MKAFLLCLLVAAVAGAAHFNRGFKQYRPRPGQVDPYGIVEDTVNNTIEGHRPDVPDPLVIDALTITAPPEVADTITGTLNVQNLNVAGLRGFQLRELSVSILFFNADFLLVFPQVVVDANYDGTGVYQQATDIWGKGTANFNIVDVEVRGSTHVNLGDPISIDSLKITITISPSSTAKVTGVLDDPAVSDSVSQYITENAPKLINDNQQLISDTLSPILEEAINKILAGTPAEA